MAKVTLIAVVIASALVVSATSAYATFEPKSEKPTATLLKPGTFTSKNFTVECPGAKIAGATWGHVISWFPFLQENAFPYLEFYYSVEWNAGKCVLLIGLTELSAKITTCNIGLRQLEKDGGKGEDKLPGFVESECIMTAAGCEVKIAPTEKETELNANLKENLATNSESSIVVKTNDAEIAATEKGFLCTEGAIKVALKGFESRLEAAKLI